LTDVVKPGTDVTRSGSNVTNFGPNVVRFVSLVVSFMPDEVKFSPFVESLLPFDECFDFGNFLRKKPTSALDEFGIDNFLIGRNEGQALLSSRSDRG